MALSKQHWGLLLAAVVCCRCRPGGDALETAAAHRSLVNLAERLFQDQEKAPTIRRQLTEQVELAVFETRDADPQRSGSSVDCRVKYRFPHDLWGLVPGLAFPCDQRKNQVESRQQEARWRLWELLSKPEAIKSSLSRQVRGKEPPDEYYRTPSEAMVDVLDRRRQLVEENLPVLLEGMALGVRLDLAQCVDTHLPLILGNLQARAQTQCADFRDGGSHLAQVRESMKRNALEAKERMTGPPVRPRGALDAELAQRCGGAKPGPVRLEVPGITEAKMDADGHAYAIHLFRGEYLRVSVHGADPVLELKLFDGTCRQQLDTAPITYRVPEEMDAVVVVRGLSPDAEYRLATFIEGNWASSDEEKARLRSVIAWAQSKDTDDEARTIWQGSADPALQAACLFERAYGEKILLEGAASEQTVAFCTGVLAKLVTSSKQRGVAATNIQPK